MKTRKSNLVSGVIALCILLAIGLACGGGKPAPAQYQGNWVGADGSTIYMHNDGSAGFKVGNKEVSGGAAEIDESAKTLTISLFGISNTWKIDREPTDRGEMTLSGTVYRKQ